MTRIGTIHVGTAAPGRPVERSSTARFGWRSASGAAIKGSFLKHGFTGKCVVEERRFSAALGQAKLGTLAPEVKA
jgi:hypothetical protein